MGANIVSERYFSVGDVIEFNGFAGKVIALTMRSTKLQTYDGSIVTFQNHTITNAKNLSTENLIKIPLAYEFERNKAYDFMNHLWNMLLFYPCANWLI